MRRVPTIIVLALCTLLFASISSAQQTSTIATTTSASVPNLIRYSGTLKDAQGAALASSSSVGVTFAIYNQQEGGAAVWQETQNVTPDSSGQYSVLLGSATAAGLPDDLFSQQEQRWLAVQIQGEAEQARVLLVSVPYAFKAHEADTLDGLPASAFVKVPSADGVIGTTTNPLNLSEIASAGVQGNASVLPPANIPVVAGNPCPAQSLNPAVATLPIFAILGTSDVLCNSVISQGGLASGANVGIGTTMPKATLDVNGAINTSQYYQIGLDTVLRLGISSIYVGQDAGPTKLTQGDETFVGYSAGNASNNFANTYIGFQSGAINTTGHQNTYVGSWSGHLSTTGFQNTLIGDTTGGGNPGNRNVMLGFEVGLNNFGGNDNITIWNPGASESNTIRIGFPYSTTNCFGQYMPPCGQTNTYIAGIYNVSLKPGYQQVIIDSTGHLGSTTSTVGGVSGNCTSPSGGTYLTGWVGSGLSTTVGCSFLFQATDNFIGIGTQSPLTALDVNGDINAKSDLSSYQIGGSTVLQTSGIQNLAVGVDACHGAGGSNTCIGFAAGSSDSSGFYNTFVGTDAGAANQGGHDNTFLGTNAGESNVAGFANVVIGSGAGTSNNGNNNVFIGQAAGTTNTGSHNIYLGYGVDNPTESTAIRIGEQGFQTSAYIAGIYNSTATPTPPFQAVCVDANGTVFGTTPLTNCVVSSRRFKDQIADMGDTSSKLLQLRPVTFFYKPQYDDGTHTLQYGLIAEEVAKVYPEMAVYDKDGQPYSVKYQLLAPMLLNELQKQHTVVSAQQDVIQTQQQQIKTQQQQMQAQGQEINSLKHELRLQNASLQERLTKLESYVASQTQTKTASNVNPATAASPSGDSQ